MRSGLYWIWAQSGRENLATIGMCEDGEKVTPINPDHRDMRVRSVGPYIGELEDAVRELTGQTARYVRPAPRKTVKQSEEVYYGA